MLPLTLLACGGGEGASTRPDVAARAPAAQPAMPILCPGGLLCESDRPLCGWRVPAACAQRTERAQICSCELPELSSDAIREFFSSRYPGSVRQEAGGLAVIAAVGERPPGAPTPTPATLRVGGGSGARPLFATPGAMVLATP